MIIYYRIHIRSCISCVLHLWALNFLRAFLFDHIDPQAVYTSQIRDAFVHHATDNISSEAQYFRAHRQLRRSFSLSLAICVRVRVRARVCVCVCVVYATYVYVTVRNRASRSYAFRSVWHFLSRLANPPTPRFSRTERSSPRIHISSGKCLVIKGKNRVKCFVAPPQSDVPLVLFA